MYKAYKVGYYQADDIHKVYYACYGNAEKKAFFVIHGGPGYGFTDDMLDAFDLKECNIVAIDQRGCGQSLPLGCIEKNNTQLLIEDIKNIADYLNIQRFSIKGESWGSTLALLFAEKYPHYVSSIILTGVFLGSNDETLIGKNGGFDVFYPEYWKQYLEMLPKEKRKNPYLEYYNYIINGSEEEKYKYSREIVFLEILMEMTVPDVDRANRICDELDCYNIAKIEMFYTINDFFVREKCIENNLCIIKDIPISIVSGRHDLIVPIKSAWIISELHPKCELFISELEGHSDISSEKQQILKRVIKQHEEYY